MGIVVGPAFSIAASGNISGICFQPVNGRTIAKAPWSGTVPNTAKQITQQGYLKSVAENWGQLLSAAERLTWERRAETVKFQGRLGVSYTPSGYQLYMKWNIRRLVMGLGMMSVAPGMQNWEHVEYLAVGWDAPNVRFFNRLSKSYGVNVDSYGVEFYRAGPFNSGGRKPIAGDWRFYIRKVPPAPMADYSVVANKWYFYKARQVAEFGDVGNWFVGQGFSG